MPLIVKLLTIKITVILQYHSNPKLGEMILNFEKQNTPFNNVKAVKELLFLSLKDIFPSNIKSQPRYVIGHIIHFIRNAISAKKYVETFVPEISNNYRKTDKEDSFQLADVFRKGGMKEIYIPSEDIENIRSLVRYRHSLGEEITLKKNKIHALLTSYGIIITATDPFGKKGLREIENNYNNLNYSDRIVLRSLLGDISFIKEREKEIETEISSIANNSDDIKLLMTIPGINFYTAAGILSEIGTINRFENNLSLLPILD